MRSRATGLRLRAGRNKGIIAALDRADKLFASLPGKLRYEDLYEQAAVAGIQARLNPGSQAAEDGLERLREAIARGLKKARIIDFDPDLEPIRRRPEYSTLWPQSP